MSRSAARWARKPRRCGSTPTAIVTVLIGSQSSGQGHQTAYAQVVAEQFGAGARTHSCPSGRYRHDRHRSRHRRFGLDSDRRRQRPARDPQARRESEASSRPRRWRPASAISRSDDGQVQVAGTDRSISFADLAKRPPPIREVERERNLRSRGRHFSERHPYGRGRDRSRHRHRQDRQLRDRRRFRRHAQSVAAGRPDPWRRDAGDRPGFDGAGGL